MKSGFASTIPSLLRFRQQKQSTGLFLTAQAERTQTQTQRRADAVKLLLMDENRLTRRQPDKQAVG